MKQMLVVCLIVILLSCNNGGPKFLPWSENTYKPIGKVVQYDDELDKIISKDSKANVIFSGFEWSEGPLWVEKHKMLLFSDVPRNCIYKWTEEKQVQMYLPFSGYTDTAKRGGEMGSNGLLLDNEGNLVLCQHGDRRMARMDAPLDKPERKFITLADKFNGKRFNSPNDAVYNSIGELFFTDPPYGLKTQDDTDPKKEIPFNGVYKVKKDGTVILLVDSISRPNGLAFFPGEKRLLVASSDPVKPNWYVFDVNGDSLSNGKIFYSATEERKTMTHGLPDGFKINKQGILFATGPGGVYIFNSSGKKLGFIKLDEATSNCALSSDEKTLYVTNDMYVLRIALK
jgi:gluconolactonase